MAVIGTAEIDVVAKTTNFDKDIKAKVGSASKDLGFFGNVVANADRRLQGLGLTTRDVGVIMGAGFAGGVAFAAREVVQFISAAIEASSALREQQSATEAMFETNSELVRSFAEGAEAIGFSERAALTATNTFGGLLQNVGFTEEAAANLSIGLVALAADISSLKDIPVEEVQQRLISGLRGEKDAVEKLDISLGERLVSERALVASGKKSVEQLTEGERVLERLRISFEQTTKAQGDLLKTEDSLANQQRKLNAEFENSKARLGDALVPAANAATKALSTTLESLNALFDRVSEIQDQEFERETDTEIFRIFGSGFGFRRRIGEEETNAIQKLKDILFGFDGTAEDAASTAEELAAAFEELEDQANQDAVAIGNLEDATEDLAEAKKKLNEVLADAERREDKAERSLIRQLQDAELAQDEAERDRAEAIEDRADQIAAAEKRVVDVQRQGNRDVRGAKERLADFERDSERQATDRLRRLIDLEKQRARAIVGAQLDIQQAQIAGDAEAENRARRELAEAQDSTEIRREKKDQALEEAEQTLELERLERDLAEAREDRKRERLEAIEEVAKTTEEANERIADADRRLAEVERDNRNSVEDAQRALDEARREGTEAVEKQTDKVNELTQAYKRQRRQVQGLTEDLNLLKQAGNANLPGMVDENGNILLNADGGLIPGGRASIVGERGPELIIPSSNSTVVSNEQLVSVLKGIGRQATGPSVVIQTGNTDPRVLANELMFRMAQDVVT